MHVERRSQGDYFTAHGIAVSTYGVMLCKNLGWDTERTLGLVAMGGIFHDVGKKDLDRSLIEKNPAEYTAEEKIEVDLFYLELYFQQLLDF